MTAFMKAHMLLVVDENIYSNAMSFQMWLLKSPSVKPIIGCNLPVLNGQLTFHEWFWMVGENIIDLLLLGNNYMYILKFAFS